MSFSSKLPPSPGTPLKKSKRKSCATAKVNCVSPRKAKIDNSVCNHDNLAGLGVYGKGEDPHFFDKRYFAANPTCWITMIPLQ
jgi:hypothetical protein